MRLVGANLSPAVGASTQRTVCSTRKWRPFSMLLSPPTMITYGHRNNPDCERVNADHERGHTA